MLASPPFNVNAVDRERLEPMVGMGRHFPFGLPRAYSPELYQRKCSAVFEHIYERYGGATVSD